MRDADPGMGLVRGWGATVSSHYFSVHVRAFRDVTARLSTVRNIH